MFFVIDLQMKSGVNVEKSSGAISNIFDVSVKYSDDINSEILQQYHTIGKI